MSAHRSACYQRQAKQEREVPTRFHTGPIHAGDVFRLTQVRGYSEPFVWEARDGLIELRSYGEVRDKNGSHKSYFRTEADLRTCRLISSNPHGQIICPALQPGGTA